MHRKQLGTLFGGLAILALIGVYLFGGAARAAWPSRIPAGAAQLSGEPPYPWSERIVGVEFDWETHQELAAGSDNWAVTWSGDGNQYAAWGDGGGFGGSNSLGRVSLGVARLEGGWPDFRGVNVWGGYRSEHPAQFGGKSYGILAIGETLYMWVSPGSNTENYREARLARSMDGGATWERAPWAFTRDEGLVLPTFAQFGPGYADAWDGYVYVYFIRLVDSSRLGIQQPGRIDLARVPLERLWDRSAYEFFGGVDGSGTPRWTGDLRAREPVFQDAAGVGWTVSVTYNRGLGRFLLATEHTASFRGNLGLYEAPTPWGPWRTVGYYTNWGGYGSVFFWNFSNRWTSEDGRRFVLIFTGTGGNDSWNALQGVFQVAGDGPTPPTATPSPPPTSTPTPTPVVTGPSPGLGRVEDGLLSLYLFDEGQGTMVRDRGGSGLSLDLRIDLPDRVQWLEGALTVGGGVRLVSTANAQGLVQRVKAANELTVEAWIRPSSLQPDGPARILAISQDKYNQNFVLGQARDRFDVRFRTTETDSSGRPSLRSPQGDLQLQLMHVVYTRDSGGTARLYINGVERSRALVGGDLTAWNEAYSLILANEFGADRRWQGTYHLVALYARALSAGEVLQNYQAGPDPELSPDPPATPTPSPTRTPTAAPPPGSGQAQIRVQPERATVHVGETFRVDLVVVTGDQALDGAAAYLDFDPAVLQVVSVVPGDRLSTVLSNTYDNGRGHVDFVAGTLGTPVTGTFTLATVTFRAIAARAETPLRLGEAAPRATDLTWKGVSMLGQRQGSSLQVMPGASLRATVRLEGRPQPPHERWITPLFVRLTPLGAPGPGHAFTVQTDTSGKFRIADIPPGDYVLEVENHHTLARSSTVALVAGENEVDMGLLLEGDAVDDEVVDLLDFSLLAAGFGRCGLEGIDITPIDFDEDGCVTIQDFSLLAKNYGETAVPSAGAGTELIGWLPGRQEGERFTVQITVSGESGQQVDAVALHLQMDPDLVRVREVRLADSPLTTELTRSWDNASGAIDVAVGSLGGGASTPFSLATLELEAVRTFSRAPLALRGTAPRTGAAHSGILFPVQIEYDGAAQVRLRVSAHRLYLPHIRR